MSCEAVRNLVTFVAVLALSIYGEGIVFNQALSSTFYSTYDYDAGTDADDGVARRLCGER